MNGYRMFLINKLFFKPSRESRRLAILENLRAEPGQSQSDLGQKTALSGAMVNKYLHECQQQGLLELQPVNGKSFRYELTRRGEEERQALLGQYLSEIVQVYSALKGNIRDKLAHLKASGVKSLVLFGASETCEVVLAALRNNSFRIVAIVDNDHAKHGQPFHQHVISHPAILEQIEFDAVVVTTFARQTEIIDQLQPLRTRKNFQITGL